MSPESNAVLYTPGSWVAVGAESGWLLVDIDPNDPIVLQCWSLIRGGAQIDEILDAVLQRGLRAVTSFALVRVAGGGRRALVLRGAARAEITINGGEQVIDADGVSTWREIELPAAASAVRVRSGDEFIVDTEAPLSPGVTLASSIRLAVGDAPLVSAAPASAPPPVPATPEPLPRPEPAPANDLNGRAERTAPPAEPIAPEPIPPKPAAPESWFAPPAVPEAVAPAPPPAPAAAPPHEPTPADRPVADLPPMPAPPTLPPIPPSEPPASELPPLPPEPEPEPEPDADSMSWLAAVKPLEPASDDAPMARPPRPADTPPGVVGGRGIGRDGPPPEQPPSTPPNGQPWSQPIPRPSEPDAADTTISRASLTGMLEQPGHAGSMVQAVRCQHGHLSPPMAVSCRVCGFPLMGQAPISVARPTLGVLRLSTGDVVPLDRTVIMGRNPKVDDANEADRPHVVRLPSPGHDISRTHVEIRLDGWHVLLTDLNSVNGTIVTPPWQEPQRLRPNESVPIEPGTVVSLADEVTFRYEVTA